MFRRCTSLISFPDISKWNTSNIKDMNSLFRRCTSLISLPNISKWNIEKVEDMSDMFRKCTSLISLPDLEKRFLQTDIKRKNILKKEKIIFN